METISPLLAICAWNSPVPIEFPTQRPVTRSFDVFVELRLNKRWVNNHETGDLRSYHAHYDVIVINVKNVIYIWLPQVFMLLTTLSKNENRLSVW